MKKNILKSVVAFFVLTSILISCDNDDDAVASPPPPGLPELLYAEGGAPSSSSVTNPIAIASTKEIFGRNGATNVIEIKLSSLAVGTYTISAVNQFTYTRPTTSSPWTAVTGTITITMNTGTEISGNFNLTAGNSSLGINSVSGSFSNITITP
jgi:hypothetical protein